MDFHHCDLEPIEGFAHEGGRGSFQREAVTSSQSPWGGIAQNSWFGDSGNSGCLKRKRRNGNVPGVRVSHDAVVLSPRSCRSGSAGSQLSSGGAYIRGAEDECFSADLGLASTAHSSGGVAEDTCFTSLVSGGRSGLTSTHSGGPLYEVSTQWKKIRPDCVFRLKGRRDLNAKATDSATLAAGMQLQLGLSDSSSVTADSDLVSSLPLGLRKGGAYQEAMKEALSSESIPVVDEGSTSSRYMKTGGYIPSLLMGRRLEQLPSIVGREKQDDHLEGKGDSLVCDCVDHVGGHCSGILHNGNVPQNNVFMSLVPGASMSTGVRSAGCERAMKICKFRGCNKGARGASGLCIIHGGGRRCQRQGCNKGAEGSTVYCKSHGGGRRCQNLGCTKSAEGKTDYCIAHGGGRRCSHDGCTKAARGRSGLCIRHGGGKRCKRDGCTKSAEGYSGLCISHGGGRRCQFEGCKKGAQGSTMFCKAHGGGKRCMIQGCNKGAEGSTPLCKGHGGGKRCLFEGGGICTKSVHGGTSFCVAHGGGKRCAVNECTKSARGRTDFCVRHGGGKRCKVESCTKSAQGSTDFCKAHGGGKRCSWGQESSPYYALNKDKTGELFKGPCERFARGKLGLCAAHAALVHDRRVHGVGVIGNTLLSGIGPGLFRGVVKNSTYGAVHTEASNDTGKLSIHMGRGLGDDGEAAISQLPILSERTAVENTDVSRDCGANKSDSAAMGYSSSLAFDGSSLKFLEEESLATDKDDGGLVATSDFGMGLWSDSLGPVGNSSALADLALESSLNLTHPVSKNGTLSKQPAGVDLSFERPMLPPQVLVPLSMRKGDLLSHDKDGFYLTGSASTSFDGTSRMLSPSLPQRGEVEQRVHGGNAIALLMGRRPVGH